MSVRFGVFASGKLKGGENILYSIPAASTGKSAIINAMRFVSGSSSVRFTIGLSRANTTTAIIFPGGREAPLGPGKMAVEDRELTLAAGEAIIATLNSADADKIDFIICGVERDS